MKYHNSVLLHESIEGLNIHPEGTYVDVTFGGGGHSREILQRLTTGKLFAFDQDEAAIANKIDDERFMLIEQNFRHLKNNLRLVKAIPVDGLLADLGVSSHQFDSAERGFSTRFDAALDMRMDTNKVLNAAEVLNTYDEAALKKMFGMYGEIKNGGKLSRLIIAARAETEIKRVMQLKTLIAPCVPKGRENQYYAKVFQALRIEVNQEMDALKELLEQSVEVLKPGGRLVFISYHSLEDRLVKNLFKTGNVAGEVKKDFYGNVISPLKVISKKPTIPSETEIINNNRARSAKLRIAEKVTIKASEPTEKRTE